MNIIASVKIIGSCIKYVYRDMKHFDEEQFKQALHRAPWDTAFVFDDIENVVYVHIILLLLLMYVDHAVRSLVFI